MRRMAAMQLALVAAAAFSMTTQPVRAQPDPRQPLSVLIAAFQNCGPSSAYQMLGPYLFQIIAQQTGGSGCYPQIARAGPITDMQIVQGQQFPVGPLYVIRVQHSSGVRADWFIGFNQVTGQVEYLSFQPVQGPPPTIAAGPSPSSGGPSTPPPVDGSAGNGEGCELYPAMCG